MAQEQFNLNWHTYSDHLQEMMQNLMQSNNFTDVTLVSEDKTRFKAHKFVLSNCSPVFESMITDLPQKELNDISKRCTFRRNKIHFAVHVSWESNIVSRQN